MLSSCCSKYCELDQGYFYCTNCGKQMRQHLDTSLTSFTQRSYFMPKSYTRQARFEKKIIGALRMEAAHKIQPNLIKYLESPPKIINLKDEGHTISKTKNIKKIKQWLEFDHA